MLVYAIIFINLAFVFYTIGVWSEKIQGQLKPWHLIIFWGGLVNDTIGTLSMEAIVKQSTGEAAAFNIFGYLPLHFNVHSVTGTLALALMLFHAVWATFVLWKKNTNLAANFHQFSLVVWILWLIPFLTGVMSHVR